MFEALNIILTKCNIPVPLHTTEDVPGKEVQLEYLEKLRFLDNNLEI
jgi:hypothetical protein